MDVFVSRGSESQQMCIQMEKHLKNMNEYMEQNHTTGISHFTKPLTGYALEHSGKHLGKHLFNMPKTI